jgi:acyl carrier protein
MNVVDDVRGVLRTVLQLGDRANSLTADSRLLGALPELDSMAVVAVVTALEERFGVVFDDDEISADTFSTVGSLVDLIKSKN